ncbi:MAG: TonB family protein [Candidatus Krumholzibacteriota bacterium]|nr:TonB family protein [Candidatus Krumholzibacteriota bacterium]
MDTVHTRLRRKYNTYLLDALFAALVLHFLIFYLIPPFEFTPYRPFEDWTTVIVDLPDPVPEIEDPDIIKEPAIKPVPLISDETGDDPVDIPITSPDKISSMVFTAMPVQEKQEFIAWDRMPVLLKYFSPVYPRLAREGGIEGTVLLRVAIAADGRVEAASIIHSNVTPSMEKAALTAVMKFEFEPAMQAHVAVRSLMAVPITFRLH